VPFEILNGALMLLGSRARPEGAKLRRLPVFGFGLREYSRYSPDFSFRIIGLDLRFRISFNRVARKSVPRLTLALRRELLVAKRRNIGHTHGDEAAP